MYNVKSIGPSTEPCGTPFSSNSYNCICKDLFDWLLTVCSFVCSDKIIYYVKYVSPSALQIIIANLNVIKKYQ